MPSPPRRRAQEDQATQLINRLTNHALGKLKRPMDASQVRAADCVLKKCLPDLAQTELTGKDGERPSSTRSSASSEVAGGDAQDRNAAGLRAAACAGALQGGLRWSRRGEVALLLGAVARGEHREKLDVVCIREVQKSLTYSVKRLLEQKIERFNAGDYFDVQDKKITRAAAGSRCSRGCRTRRPSR
jgi:hypothetical protein